MVMRAWASDDILRSYARHVTPDEILDPELDAITVPQNDPDPLRHLLPRGGSQHFGIAAELNRVIRLWRECQLRIPNLIFS
jgi:hypothetical protein